MRQFVVISRSLHPLVHVLITAPVSSRVFRESGSKSWDRFAVLRHDSMKDSLRPNTSSIRGRYYIGSPSHRASHIGLLVLRCLVGQAPSYLCDLCHSLSYYTGRCTVYTVLLCRWQLGSIICSHCNNARHYFSVVNLPTCICLSLTLCTLQLVANSQFHQLLEIAFFRLVWVERASE